MEVFRDLILFITGLVLGQFLPSYMRKKGENLATKEDIEKITEQVEKVKAEIGSQLYVHQIRYENEYKILMELSEKVIDLRNTAFSLRPAMQMIDTTKTEEERKKEKLSAYADAAIAFNRFCEQRKPFYPEDIYSAVRKLDQAAWKEAVQFRHSSDRGENYDPKYWDKAMANGQEITNLADDVMKAIRDRVNYWEKFETSRSQA